MQSSGVVAIVRILSSLTSIIIFSLTRLKAERPLFYECFSSAHQGNASTTVMMFHSSFFTMIFTLLLAASLGIPLVAAAEITVEDLFAKITQLQHYPGSTLKEVASLPTWSKL